MFSIAKAKLDVYLLSKAEFSITSNHSKSLFAIGRAMIFRVNFLSNLYTND